MCLYLSLTRRDLFAGNQAAVSGPGPGSGSYSTGDMLAQSGFDVNRSLSMRGVQIVPGYVTNAEGLYISPRLFLSLVSTLPVYRLAS